MTTKQEWEAVTDDTERLTVPGGWLYRVDRTEPVGMMGSNPAVALCFVPDLNFYAPVGRLNHDGDSQT